MSRPPVFKFYPDLSDYGSISNPDTKKTYDISFLVKETEKVESLRYTQGTEHLGRR